MFVDVTSICFQNKICLSTWVSLDLLFVRLLAAGAVTARGTEEAPELAHHVREGGVVGRHGGSGEALGQRVQHGVVCGVFLPSPHLLLISTRQIVSWLRQVLCLRCGGDCVRHQARPPSCPSVPAGPHRPRHSDTATLPDTLPGPARHNLLRLVAGAAGAGHHHGSGPAQTSASLSLSALAGAITNHRKNYSFNIIMAPQCRT